MSALVTFICRRFSLAIVAVGGVVMLLMFVTVQSGVSRLASYGVSFRGTSTAVDVQIPQGDLQSGDRIDLATLTPPQRFTLLNYAAVGSRIAVTALRDGKPFTVDLVAQQPEYSNGAKIAQEFGLPLCFFLSLGLASALLLMRPRAETLAFYGYCILMLIKVYQTSLDLVAWPMNFGSELLMQVVYPATDLAILFFAYRLYGRPGRLWPWISWTAVGISIAVWAIWTDPIVWLTLGHYGVTGPDTRSLKAFSDVALLTVTIAGLAYVASGAEGIDRRRVSWIVGGIALAPLLDLTWALTDIASVVVQDRSTALLTVEWWANALLPWAGLSGIVAVVYGFLSERVVDFRVVIGRAALYGGTTLAIVVVFGAVEWLAEQIFESTRPAMYVSLIAALAIGFAMRAVHDRLGGFIDGVFFKRQRQAEEALRRAARALANTTSERTLIEFLVHEPVVALELTAGALFLARTEGGRYERVAALGWGDEHASGFESDDVLPVMLRAGMEPIRLDAHRRVELQLPGSDRLEALIVPLVMRAKIFGFAFYGERRDGAAFTPEESELLLTLATGASSAYDHIDADRSHARIADLERRLASAGGVEERAAKASP